MKQSIYLSVFVILLLFTGCSKDLSEYGSDVPVSSMQETIVFRCANLKQRTEDFGKESVKVKSIVGVGLVSVAGNQTKYIVKSIRTEFDASKQAGLTINIDGKWKNNHSENF